MGSIKIVMQSMEQTKMGMALPVGKVVVPIAMTRMHLKALALQGFKTSMKMALEIQTYRFGSVMMPRIHTLATIPTIAMTLMHPYTQTIQNSVTMLTMIVMVWWIQQMR
jgi:hypothetical protein